LTRQITSLLSLRLVLA